MLRDVFYFGKKPNVHPKEQSAKNLIDARKKASTEHFWVINEFCDYSGFDWDFDFEFLPDEDVWSENHNNVWPSVHQKDSGTWLCPKQRSDVIVYRNDVDPLRRKYVVATNWKIIENIDTSKWDFTWHPDPTDPPYIYKWGCKYFPVEFKSCIEYHVDGATEVKYMNTIVELLPNWERVVENQKVDQTRFDMSWRPDPRDPPYIYVWGNKWVDGRFKSTFEYHVPGATEKKYMPELIPVMPEWEKWNILHSIDKTKFDFTWRPDPREPDLIYVFGNEQYDSTVMPTVEYVMPGATVKKYVTDVRAKLIPEPEKFQHLEKSYGIDYSWVPDPTAPPYIYAWGNQWNKPEDKISIQYVVAGATEYKYMEERAIRRPCMDNWEIPSNIDTAGFDFSWEPSPADPPYIYEFGTQHQKTGGPRYVVEGATEVKYIEFQKAKALPTTKNWEIPKNLDINGFDFSWHPDNTSPPYVYHFATQWALTGGPIYRCENAIEVKYLEQPSAIALPDKTNWLIPNDVDADCFDFSWHPYVEDQPYVYVFGTQHQKTGGPKYMTPGVQPGSPIKYIDRRILQAKRLPNKAKFAILNNYKIKDFDYSWHPDETEEPYIYVFGNNQYSAEIMPTIEYVVSGATQVKYIDGVKAILDIDKLNWEIHVPIDESKFDFTWKPNPKDPPYIYSWGNKFISNKYKSTVDYVVPGATEYKYMTDDVEVLPEWDRWIIPDNIDTTGFDFTWRPDPLEPDLIWQFGTQHQKTGGPRYVMPGATETKYVTAQQVKALPNRNNWELPKNVDVTDFDFSWHPDSTSPPYIYHFATQWALSGGPIYRVKGAVEVKYMEEPCAKALPNRDNWEIPSDIDIDSFDFSWHPYVEDQPYVYQFGTQHQKTGGPRYVTPGVIPSSPVKYIDTRILKAKKLPNKKNFAILNNYNIKDFDYSWHPDDTEEPYIYVFGNSQYSAEIMPTIEYIVPGAKQIKYVESVKATLGVDKINWVIHVPVDETKFDFSWKPNPKDPPYIYVWGNRFVNGKYKSTVEYVIPNATEYKYMTDDVEVLPEWDRWSIPDNIDTTGFDFSWRPDPLEPDLIWQFGTQWQKTGGPRYIVPGATETKYINIQKANILPDRTNWILPANIDVTDFDFSWHPDATSPPYDYHFATQWALSGGPVYKMPGATSKKYIDFPIAKSTPTKDNWIIPNNIAIDEFDFSWHPYMEDDPYIYQFGTQHQKTGGPRYVTPGAKLSSPVKYIDTRILKARKLPEKEKFTILDGLKILDFDYSWHPDETDGEYVYVFGNTQYPAEIMPTIQYKSSPYADAVKYINEVKATLAPDKSKWKISNDVDIIDFDFSWKPNPKDPPYIYVFGNTQYSAEDMPTVEYHVKGAKKKKYVHDIVAKLAPNKKFWNIPETVEIESFDFSWKPNPNDPPYIYQFGTQWQKTDGPRYIVRGAKEIKYIDDIKSKRKPSLNNWEVPLGIDVSNFDFSWHPDATDPPYIYQFGTVLDDNDGPRYITPGNDGTVVYKHRITRKIDEREFVTAANEVPIQKYYIETTLEALVKEHSTEIFWALNSNIDYTNFDFNWRPEVINVAWESKYVNVFGSPDSVMTHTYFVNAKSYLNGNTDLKFIEDTKLNENYLSKLFVKPDMFFVDRGNSNSGERFENLKNRFGDKIQKTRYLNSWVDTINRCINRSTTNLCWILNSELDYTDFDFNYYPNPWQMKMVHVFGTQWSHWGTTFLVNRETFSTDTKYIKIIEHLSNLNFVKTRTAKATNVLYDIIYVNHGNLSEEEMQKITQSGNQLVDYDTDYFVTFKKLLEKLPEKKEHYIWIASTICDYKDFDFTYICDPFAREQLHVFPSEKQKFGDTFLVNVNKLRELINDMQSLKDYGKINYNQHQRTTRLAAPVVITEFDTHVASVVEEFNFPYATFITSDNKDIVANDEEPMSLWDNESKNIVITSTGGTRIVVPKEVKQYVETQLYDYPYIKTASRLAKSNPLDVVFLSNGEKCADENYEHLLKVTKGLPNRIVRVDGVNGRVEAYHAAAEASNTAWMFTVFAKLKVNAKFDFNWQPDRLQIPKHYMFLAKNSVNGLVYGHQGMIAYNKQMTLDNSGYGLDFTLDSPHETVESLSGIAIFNTDEFSTWRTAFREAIKLKKENSETSLQRLNIWLTVAEGDYAEYSIRGAIDGVEYFEKSKGKLDKLRLSYEWKWLSTYFKKKYKC